MTGSQVAGIRVADACRSLLGPPDTYVAPKGYDGLALAIIDAIWSIGVRYGGVGNVVVKYRDWVEKQYGQTAQYRSGPELLDDLAAVGGPEAFASSVVVNRQRTSSRGGILKAVAVEQAARALAGQGVETTADLVGQAAAPGVRAAWVGVHGQSSGVSWHYLLMNARVDDIKADRMICRFVADALGVEAVPSTVAYGEVLAAYESLRVEAPTLTLRALDHRIWSYQRSRETPVRWTASPKT